MNSAIATFIGTLLIKMLELYLKGRAADEKTKQEFIAFVEIMNAKGLASVQMRINARSQVDRVAEMWNEEEKQKAGKQ